MIRFISKVILGMVGLLVTSQGIAAGFSAAVAPPRFELASQSGKVVRQTVEIYNVSSKNEQYAIKTNDWSLKGNNLQFYDPLQANSCRKWVKLERRKVTVRKNNKRAFRFEVHIPQNAPQQECRFAIMIEGLSAANTQISDSLNMPVNGRLAVIVYLSVNGAEPKLTISSLRKQGNQLLAHVKNTGKAHGRLQGTLAGVDARGQQLDLSISSMPIMAGESRILPLSAHLNGKQHKGGIHSPVKLEGELYWLKGAFSIKTQVQ